MLYIHSMVVMVYLSKPLSLESQHRFYFYCLIYGQLQFGKVLVISWCNQLTNETCKLQLPHQSTKWHVQYVRYSSRSKFYYYEVVLNLGHFKEKMSSWVTRIWKVIQLSFGRLFIIFWFHLLYYQHYFIIIILILIKISVQKIIIEHRKAVMDCFENRLPVADQNIIILTTSRWQLLCQ